MKKFLSFAIFMVLLLSVYVYDRFQEDEMLKPASTDIFMAIEGYDIKYIKKYIKNKQLLTIYKEYTGETPLIYAINYPFITKNESFHIVQLLIPHTDINSRSVFNGNTALLCSVVLNDYRITQYLLEHGADPNIANINGDTPLTSFPNTDNACKFIRLLVKYGGNIYYKNKKGETPLTIAKKYKNKYAIECIKIVGSSRVLAGKTDGFVGTSPE
jgi:hypothetical protein